MTLRCENLTPRIGVRLHTDLDTLLSGREAAALRELLEQRSVIVIRGIEMTDDEQIAFSRTLGTLAEKEGIYTVTMDPRLNPRYAELNRIGNVTWHMDRTDLDMPNFCSILRPLKLSPTGGETQFASTYAAYEDLSEEEKQRFDDMKVVYRLAATFRESVPNPTEEQLAFWNSYPPKTHPLVWHHRSGRNSLMLSMQAAEVVGMDKAEGEALLARLMKHATRPEYVYTHHWQMGDIVLWDNTGTMHRVLPYDPDSGRALRRTTLEGEERAA